MNSEERKKILSGRKAAPQLTPMENLISWAKTILSSLLIVMVVNGLLIASFVVPTPSMENEVIAGDFLFVNKFIYGGSSPQTIPFFDLPLPYFRLPGLRDPEKRDVIVFIYPGDRDRLESDQFMYYLKRCIATYGDTLQIIDKRIYINGVEQPLPEHAIVDGSISRETSRIFPPTSGFSRDNWGPMRIPKTGDVIPLNDSTYIWYNTFIQREGHTLDREGEIFMVDNAPTMSYTVERDYVFAMGDNRDNSEDSRFWGFVPVENVVGTPLIVYWSWAPDIPISHFVDKISSIRWNRIFTVIN